LPIDRSTIAVALEIGLSLLGLVLLWRISLGPRARARPRQILLPPWAGNGSDLLGLLISAVAGVLVVSFAAKLFLQGRPWDETHRELVGAVAFQFGLLLGIASFHLAWRRLGTGLEAQPFATLIRGAATFLAALPIVYFVTFTWQELLGALGAPLESQDSLKLFEDLHSWPLRLLFSAIAIVVAPLAEELIFRAGLFRFFRGRLPYWLAVFLPAVIFGACHLLQAPLQNLPEFMPLVALGAVFSVAYERTGRIGTTMVAHALFNLNTVLFLWAGLRA
jgi:membrane protease YdiL (CAAX protease family)